MADVLDSDVRGDVRDLDTVVRAVAAASPEIVLHLAAQPLVRESYRDPVGTIATNVMGTVHVIEGGAGGRRRARDRRRHDGQGLRQPRMAPPPTARPTGSGGHDPYSAGKAAAEIVCASLRASFLAGADAPRLATARAGNVIGGGDFAADRLIPDCLAAFEAGDPVVLRYPDALRPWQHVLEPLCGYLGWPTLCGSDGAGYAQAWNFGPGHRRRDPRRGGGAARGGASWRRRAGRPRERGRRTCPRRACFGSTARSPRTRLRWRPRWRLAEAVARSAAWRRAWRAGRRHEDLRRGRDRVLRSRRGDAAMSRFDLIETPIRGVVALVRKPLGDARGAFERLYCAHDLGAVLGERTIVQINRSLTGAAGTVRGLHFQHPPHAETKDRLLPCAARSSTSRSTCAGARRPSSPGTAGS